LISGENGFGKTTFLHSLLWCLYGRLASDVEASLRKEILNGGYSSLLVNNLNNSQKSELEQIPKDSITRIKKSGYQLGDESIKALSQYYVEMEFSEVVIPSIPCSSLTIRRGYDAILEKEFVDILIDGTKNELTNEIGPEIFINDFVLNKDIARFFFFDSEQIVSLAETNSPADKKKLCSAYNEVLGVRKYEDLKHNLESIRVRFRKRSNDVASKNKLNALMAKRDELTKIIDQNRALIESLDTQLASLQAQNDEYQLQLVREGNSATVEEIKRLQGLLVATQSKDAEYKQLLKSFLEYAPFAICGKLFVDTKLQVEHDHIVNTKNTATSDRNLILSEITSDLSKMIQALQMEDDTRSEIQNKMQTILDKYKGSDAGDKSLLEISDADYKEFMSIFGYITSTYKSEFERLADDYKKNKQVWERTARRLSVIESKERDSLIKSIRVQKNEVEAKIAQTNTSIRDIIENNGTKTQELAVVQKQLSELLKKVDLDDMDAKKDELAETLSQELNSFLVSLKQEKKFSLERRIKSTLNNLMHKDDFIHRVSVNVVDENMDIDLYAVDGSLINKDMLSKGEQQLYATSILKALVDESGIKFPVFIDSPLQKFDKSHATKIITEFYPTISSQVVLFPLLYKELTPEELEIMKPLVNSSYLIKNDTIHSYFEKKDINTLMPVANVQSN
jgi:DNA sulfur modification protein DndD